MHGCGDSDSSRPASRTRPRRHASLYRRCAGRYPPFPVVGDPLGARDTPSPARNQSLGRHRRRAYATRGVAVMGPHEHVDPFTTTGATAHGVRRGAEADYSGEMSSEPRDRRNTTRVESSGALARRLANEPQVERYYAPDRNAAMSATGGSGSESEVQAMCALLAAVSLRLIREREARRQRLMIVK